ncbi:MAG TPA: histidine--tRNA ligase, partial [Tepidisphaeraceae bacterium]|nr:histidine--tRNA ligase [Tepidisphaeraceae bacterium]
MSQKLQAPRGTQDVLPAESGKWQAIEAIAREVARDFNYGEIRTPTFESTELFHRGVGETTDIVKKETYTFTDRGERSLTLRPEGTAGAVRAAIEHGFLDQQGARLKVYYIGSNYRYEKPQKGRYHIHHQFGVEAFGVADPMQDAECILLHMEFYRRAGLRELSLRVNSLGDSSSKQKYREMLRAHLSPSASKLSEDSQRRLEENPLRILDSKDPRDIEACKGAPPSLDALTPESRAHFDTVCKLLESSNLKFEIDS